MRTLYRVIPVVAIAFAMVAPLFGGGRVRERKLLLTPTELHTRVPDDVMREGVRVLAEYEAMQAVAVPDISFDIVASRLVRAGFDIVEMEDTIHTPRRAIDPESDVVAPYDAGLLIIQFIAPAKSEWQAEISAMGVIVVESLPGRALVATATAAQAATLRKAAWVQYLGAYLPSYKFAPAAGEGQAEFTIHMADTPLSAAAIERVRDRVGGWKESRYGTQLNARVIIPAALARDLLNDPFVLGIEAYVPPQASDERQAIGLTGVTQPSGGNYLSWLAQRSIYPNQLTQSGIVVDVADSGVDLGCINASNLHADLKGRTVYHGGSTGSSTDYKDSSGHGTLVAGIIGGNPTSGIDSVGGATAGYGQRDGDSYGQFYYGLGVAPGVRIGSTKMLAGFGTVGTVPEWTTYAVSRRCNTPTSMCTATLLDCPATVQNHSNNEYNSTGTNAGVYTTNAREFDISVRNANRSANPATRKQLAVTFSAGNYGQNANDLTTLVLAPATAKNVISVGAAESVRQSIPSTCAADQVSGTNPLLRHNAQGYNALAYLSRRGTTDGRLKPDLIAPATLVLGPRTFGQSTSYCMTGGNDGSGEYLYHGASGTSFAAPVAAGAIALLRYHFTTQYGIAPPSPAMYKAMLVAGSRSLTGAPDRLETHLAGAARTVSGWPNPQQGFGMITLTDLLSPNVAKTWHDQQTILLQGQMYQRTVVVADPTKPVRIVLAWTDAPAAVGASIVEVNGLNLSAGLSDGVLYGNYVAADGFSRTSPGCGRPVCPSPYDNRNNVEVVNIHPSRFSNLANQSFVIKVMASPLNAEGVPGASGGAFNQDFALFVLNGVIQ